MQIPFSKFLAALLAFTSFAVLAEPLPSDKAAAPVELRLFAGGKSARPDLLRKVLDEYQAAHPQVKISISIGSATSELQRKYLTTLLNAKDATYDAILLDIINPAQFASAQWIEPLNSYLGDDAEALFKDFLPVYRQADWYKGQVIALPAYSDAMFMFYRKDLTAKYGIAEPQTWAELAQASKTILAGEQSSSREGSQLEGLSIQGAAIEGAVCTFLLPYWSQGGDLINGEGRLDFNQAQARDSFNLWLGLINQGVIGKNTAEVTTNDTLNKFKAGKAVFAINWGFAWDKFQQDADSAVRDKVGIIRLPAVTGGQHSTCVGGGQWAVSAFSRHKQETVALIRHLSSPHVSRFFALNGGLLPTRTALYSDSEILGTLPWLTLAEPVLLSAKSRPVTPRYGEVSNTVRATTSAVLSGVLSVDDGVAELDRRLTKTLR